MLTEQQLSHMNAKIDSLRSQLEGNHDSLEHARKVLDDALKMYGDALEVNGGYKLHVDAIKNEIREREDDVERLAIDLTRHEVALKNNQYIDD